MVNIARTIDLNEGDNEDGDGPSPAEFSNDRRSLLRPVVGNRTKLVGYISTTWAAALLLFITIAMGVIAIAAISQSSDCEYYYYLLYARAIYWLWSHLCDAYFRKKHVESRIGGYLDFYIKSMKVSRSPHHTSNIFNILLLTLGSLIHQYYGDLTGRCISRLINPIHVIATLIVLESIITSTLLIVYIKYVQHFNRQKSPPDALCNEWMASFITDSYNGGEVGFREDDNHISDLLEKQADLIRHLKEQNERLKKKVLILSTQLQGRHEAGIC